MEYENDKRRNVKDWTRDFKRVLANRGSWHGPSNIIPNAKFDLLLQPEGKYAKMLTQSTTHYIL